MKHYFEEVESVVKHVWSTPEGLSTQEAEKRLAANEKTSFSKKKPASKAFGCFRCGLFYRIYRAL